MQNRSFKPHPQDALESRTVHPASRTGIPGPASMAGVIWRSVDVGSDNVRLYLVASQLGPRASGYALMYPGSWAMRSNGGVNKSAKPARPNPAK